MCSKGDSESEARNRTKDRNNVQSRTLRPGRKCDMRTAKNLKSSENWRSQFVTSNLVDSKIANKIVVLRDVQVMIDRDIAELYGVEIKVLNQAVKRNAERFPKQFMFQLSLDEYRSVKESLWSQFVTIENIGDLRGRHSKYLPHAFTEQGVAMLSAVLHLRKWKILKL